MIRARIVGVSRELGQPGKTLTTGFIVDVPYIGAEIQVDDKTYRILAVVYHTLQTVSVPMPVDVTVHVNDMNGHMI